MPDFSPSSRDFLQQVRSIIELNLANESFGVSELADALHMSRSNLLRKVKKETNLSVSQLINQVRLTRAMELLRTSTLNVSEVAHAVGFGSTSYFIKCFREYYGYPPGEALKHAAEEPLPVHPVPGIRARGRWMAIAAAGAVLTVAVYLYSVLSSGLGAPEKSIAVLPFKNESNDSTNVYLINGLMESTLGHLQKIKELRVISRTSSEKYRNTNKSSPEVGRELNVRYFVEGSGQKIGNQILLTIQLIDAASDRHLWSRQYRREATDIFALQEEVARNIADEIKVFITPDEERRIIKRPTENLIAYDLYLKGKDAGAAGGGAALENAIEYFKQAVAEDPQFALAYAEAALAYYYLDIFRSDKKHQQEIDEYADKAMLFDSKLGESLVAKAVAYMSKREFDSVVPYLEKALEYNPNSAAVIGFLSDFYAMYSPNTAKYLEYALMGVQLNIAALDSVTASYTYLRLGNALIQNGFVNEALHYVDKSLEYNPNNPYSRYVRAFILFAKTRDAGHTRDLLIAEYVKDSSRFDILQDIAKVSYYMRDNAAAYRYYKQFVDYRESRKLDVYQFENLRIAYVYAKAGDKQKAEELTRSFKEFTDRDPSIYKNLALSGYYTYLGDQSRAVEHMKLFAKEDNVQYWVILFLEDDPSMESIIDNPEFIKYFNDAKNRFWTMHKALKRVLEEKGLI